MSIPILFNRKLLPKRRQRAASSFSQYDFLIHQVAERMIDRLYDTHRHFPIALDLGAHTGQLAALLKNTPKINTLIQTDISLAMLHYTEGLRVVMDEEWIAFKEDSFDVILSCLNLHWVNDLPGCLIQLRRILKPDGLLIITLPGIGTLGELREVMLKAEAHVKGGVSPHISPFLDVKEAGHLLQRAGFSMPVSDTETLTISYPTLWDLWRDLRGMGETNLLHERAKRGLTRAEILLIEELYKQAFSLEDGTLKATFEMITMTGMK